MLSVLTESTLPWLKILKIRIMLAFMIAPIGVWSRFIQMTQRWPADTVDLDRLSWSPDGRFIALCEPMFQYNVLIYYPDGRLVTSYSAYDSGLGIKNIKWSPSGQFLSIGSYDQKVLIFKTVSLVKLLHMETANYVCPSQTNSRI